MTAYEALSILSDEALIHMGREFAKQLRVPEPPCPGEPEAADVVLLLVERLEAAVSEGAAKDE